MAKHRKTRKQKLRSDKRLEQAAAPSSETITPQQVQSPTVFTYSQKNPPTAAITGRLASADTTYNYIGHDLRKTGLITSSIVVAELILFFVIR